MVKLLSSLRLCFVIVFLVLAIVRPKEFAATWSEEEHQLTTDTAFDGFPSVIEMDDGTIWIVWVRNAYGNYILHYTTSHDFGATWSSPKNLTSLDSGDSTTPCIAQLMNGTIMVAWSSNRPPPLPPPEPNFDLTASPMSLVIRQNSSDTSTIAVTSMNNFIEPVELKILFEPPNVDTTLDPHDVTPAPNSTAESTLTVSVGPTAIPGNYTLTIMGKSKLSHRSRTLNIAFEITASDTFGYTASSFFAQSSGTEEYGEDYEIYYKASSDYGATWSNDIQLTDNADEDLNPVVVQLRNGTIMVVWQSDREGSDDIWYIASSDGGETWSAAIPLTTDPYYDWSPTVTQTADGKIWVAWTSYRTGDFEILYRTYNGLFWSDDINLCNDSSKSDTSPSILQSSDGTIWVFWASGEVAETETPTDDIYYKYSRDNGATWSSSIQFTTNEYDDTWVSTTQTSDKKVWVVWTSNRGGQPDGNSDVYYRWARAPGAPIALFTYTPSFPRAGEPITFNASASYSPEGSAVVSHSWDFGDNTTSTDMVIIHIYQHSGNYTVTLTIEDMLGNEDTASMSITVNETTIPTAPLRPEIFGTIAAAITIGLILVAFFFRKRKGEVTR